MPIDQKFGVIDTVGGYYFIVNDDDTGFGVPASPTQSTTDGKNWSAADGEWHYFTMVFEPRSTTHYKVWTGFDGHEFAWNGHTLKEIGINSIHFDARSMYGNTQSKISVAHVAFYNRAITGTEVATHYRRGIGYLGETVAARLTRYLTAHWGGPFVVGPSTGLQLAADHDYDGTSVLSALTDVTRTDSGLLFVDGAGVVQAESRLSRHVSTTVAAVLGETELPYTDISYDFDPTWVYSETSLSRPDRSGSLVDADPVAEAEYGQRTLSRSMQVTNDFDLEQAGIAFRTRYREPRLRVSELTLDPASNPALWDFVLSAEISQRVTVRRRTAAGVTISGDFHIESIKEDVDIEASTWKTTYELSPVFVPLGWILGSATRGVLGTSTVPVY